MDVRSEALRYLRYNGTPDEQTAAMLERGERELRAAIGKAFCFRVMDKADCGEYLVGNDINNHLSGCNKVIFFAATLGLGVDRLIRSAEITDMAYALILDSLASALTEEYCDECEGIMHEKTGGNYKWRFSPGYGDYPISVQNKFIRLISADKQIGLTATENHILIPRKSVTAVIGITEEAAEKRGASCDICNMRETCMYRKEGKSCGR